MLTNPVDEFDSLDNELATIISRLNSLDVASSGIEQSGRSTYLERNNLFHTDTANTSYKAPFIEEHNDEEESESDKELTILDSRPLLFSGRPTPPATSRSPTRITPTTSYKQTGGTKRAEKSLQRTDGDAENAHAKRKKS